MTRPDEVVLERAVVDNLVDVVPAVQRRNNKMRSQM
jgi:hypothetical protein